AILASITFAMFVSLTRSPAGTQLATALPPGDFLDRRDEEPFRAHWLRRETLVPVRLYASCLRPMNGDETGRRSNTIRTDKARHAVHAGPVECEPSDYCASISLTAAQSPPVSPESAQV